MCTTEGELPWMLRCEQPPAVLRYPGTVPDTLFASHSTGQCWHTGQGASNGLQHHFFNLISPLPCYSLKLKSIIFLRDFSPNLEMSRMLHCFTAPCHPVRRKDHRHLHAVLKTAISVEKWCLKSVNQVWTGVQWAGEGIAALMCLEMWCW